MDFYSIIQMMTMTIIKVLPIRIYCASIVRSTFVRVIRRNITIFVPATVVMMVIDSVHALILCIIVHRLKICPLSRANFRAGRSTTDTILIFNKVGTDSSSTCFCSHPVMHVQQSSTDERDADDLFPQWNLGSRRDIIFFLVQGGNKGGSIGININIGMDSV